MVLNPSLNYVGIAPTKSFNPDVKITLRRVIVLASYIKNKGNSSQGRKKSSNAIAQMAI